MKKLICSLVLVSVNFLCFSQWTLLPDHIQGLTFNSGHHDIIMTNDGLGYKRVITPNANTEYIYKTSNDWQSETLISSVNPNSIQLDFINDLIGIKVLSSNGVDSIYKTLDGGNSWNSWFTTSHISKIQLLNDSTLFYANTNNTTGLTINRIINQQQKVIYTANDSVTFLTGNGFHFLDSNYGYILSVNPSQRVAPNILKKTSNGGGIWFDVFPQGGTQLTCLKFQNATTGYFGNNNGNIYKTTDSGLNWRSIQTPLSASVNDFAFGLNNSVYASSQNGMLIKSIDNGVSWSPENVGTSKSIIDIQTIENSPIVYAITSDGEVYKNGLLTNIQTTYKKNMSVSIYPNPSNHSIHVNSEESIKSIILIDINGKTILETNKSNLNVSSLSSGIYFLSIRTISAQTILKFVKE